jgi:uncharacterized SAM-binding protein YcdF (DUF218 family)
LAVKKQSSKPALRVVYRGRKPGKRGAGRAFGLPLLISIPAGCAIFVSLLLAWAIAARAFARLSNTNRQSFDAIIVLGTPADSDGNPTPELLDRVTEGVHEYERGVAPRLIVTGAAAHNHFVEAEVMAHVAEAKGVPAPAIFEEPRALDTIQNACYSNRILQSHGWHSAEVVSSTYHLPRAAMIFARLAGEEQGGKLEWRMHEAHDNLAPGYYGPAATIVETIKTARYLVWSRWAESCPE